MLVSCKYFRFDDGAMHDEYHDPIVKMQISSYHSSDRLEMLGHQCDDVAIALLLALHQTNEHICSVEGHVFAIEAKGNASENRITCEGGVLLVIDASELLCLDTKDIACGPDPIYQV